MRGTSILELLVIFRPQKEGHVPHRTSCTFVPMIWIMQYSDAHSSNVLCTAFMVVAHFWPFFCICAFYGRLSLAYKFSSSADPISLSVLCPWRQRRSLSVAACWANCERCHVGRCGEGEELGDSNLKFKCFERYETQLFEEHCTPFFSSVGSELWKSSNTVTQQLKKSQVEFYTAHCLALAWNWNASESSKIKIIIRPNLISTFAPFWKWANWERKNWG